MFKIQKKIVTLKVLSPEDDANRNRNIIIINEK